MKLLSSILHRLMNDIRSCRIALLLLSGYLLFTQYLFHTVCPFAILTGLPCPACGLTRATVNMLTGHFSEAWQQNPAVFLWLPLLLFLAFFRYVFGQKPPLGLPLTILVCLITLGAYSMRMLLGINVSVPCQGLFFLVLQHFQ